MSFNGGHASLVGEATGKHIQVPAGTVVGVAIKQRLRCPNQKYHDKRTYCHSRCYNYWDCPGPLSVKKIGNRCGEGKYAIPDYVNNR